MPAPAITVKLSYKLSVHCTTGSNILTKTHFSLYVDRLNIWKAYSKGRCLACMLADRKLLASLVVYPLKQKFLK